jgi:hypothetical protein
MNPDVIQRDGFTFLRGDASKFKPRPMEGESLKQMEAYIEGLKVSNPLKYAAIMKDREVAMRQRKLQQERDGESKPDQGPSSWRHQEQATPRRRSGTIAGGTLRLHGPPGLQGYLQTRPPGGLPAVAPSVPAADCVCSCSTRNAE